MALKEYTFITLGEMSDYLKIDHRVVGLDGLVKATKTIQNLIYTAVAGGPDGNNIQIEYTSGGTAGSEVVTVTNELISVQIDDSVSTATQIKDAIDLVATALVSVATTGLASTAQNIVPPTNLAGGAYSQLHDARLVRVLSEIINSACQKIEKMIDGPVLIREFTEEQDGSNSNSLKPHHHPVVSITEIKIDYNRNFVAGTEINPAQYFVRGGSDIRQTGTDPEIRIVGNDVVLRDDNEQFILGRIFAGSVLGSIRIKYKAGWGKDLDDIPSDLKLACYMLAKYFWFQRENNDVGVTSKSVKGESYTRMKDGVPEAVWEMTSPYQDLSLGTRPVPQRNYFSI
ncbi:MAG: hypothetical protein SGI96_21150 [Bacteroidota bacterium]|nr:hypothetical protein [Bacteroidota bacterium]